MSRVRTGILALAALPVLAGCPTGSRTENPMKIHGLTIERIEPEHRVVLADGLVIDGDAQLAAALQDARDIREIVVLERMPPVFVVTFADGESRRYRSRRLAP
ncbi:hypothetical protein BAL199_09945 [alpha proteobacterium BAL199]|jgi:hypothetical protein|nr:hypothetical protein BAL199_09945 [alpha proteobacterium BAL199]